MIAWCGMPAYKARRNGPQIAAYALDFLLDTQARRGYTYLMTSTRCTSCADFDTDRPATCTARYQSPTPNTASDVLETLCDSCASNALIYTDVRPFVEARTDTPTSPIELPDSSPLTFAPWFKRLIDLDLTCDDWKAYEAKAYIGYTRYCASIGVIPVDLDNWLRGFRINPAETLYFENDARHDLAARVNSYTRIIANIFA